MPSAVITGTGMCVPERVVTNAELERLVDTSDAWIRTRTGIRERRLVAPGEQASTDLAEGAARQALAAAGVPAQALDLIVVATCTPDYPAMPAVAPLLAGRLGAERAGGFDLSLACTGFVAALATVQAFVRSGAASTALVVGVDVMSSIIDWSDRSTCVIFADGAGAAVVRASPAGDALAGGEVLHASLGMQGNETALVVPAGGSRRPLGAGDAALLARGDNRLRMAGQQTFRFAVTTMAAEIERAARAVGVSPAEFALVVPHQVNERIIAAAIERLGYPRERVVIDIDRWGNTCGGSVPIALDEAVRGGRVQPGDLVCLVAFGAGLSWGSAVLRWR
ncbi:MAG: 3-oxoacyl-[acyl-carrier-protein] synthase 3 [Planctomycetota bacterium]|nr:MAG: 3-oxoacyl-[acyl-carrier-protein] synthase 3 [Planctomycetota bacterium]